MIELEHESCTESAAKKRPWALENLPPFPVVAARLTKVLSAEDVDIAEVGKLIASDAAFASRVLQMANSPLFALERQVTNISHAIIVLGLNRVKAITLTRALGDYVAPVLKNRALYACWQNSLAGALLAEKLARPCQIGRDLAYLAGLLRDLGRLALLVKYPEAFANLLVVSGEHNFDLLQTERDLFEVDHCQAGACLMQTLPLPQELGEAVAHHHDVCEPPFRLVHLVRVADRLAEALGFGALPGAGATTCEQVLEDLPETARVRVAYDPETWKAEIDARIQSWC